VLKGLFGGQLRKRNDSALYGKRKGQDDRRPWGRAARGRAREESRHDTVHEGEALRGARSGEEQHGRDEFVDRADPAPVDRDLAAGGWRRAEEIVRDDDLDMLILDEINVAVAFGLIEIESVLSFMKNKPERLELILTGRYAPERMIELADTVTEMREIRHHFSRGVAARKGIEY
jgi:ATP:corrinoid adenosyltransferase